jgi:hypothetical protein
MSLWYVAHLTTYLDLESCKILRSGFGFKSNLTSAIGDLASCGFLASYVFCHKAMAYDRKYWDPQVQMPCSTALRSLHHSSTQNPWWNQA